ncbi:MAG: nucleotidyltransferase [Actinomycetota bacterium]|nr:nucleotidyltransferase family protein [Actinomycetota bacterium]
MSHEAKHAEERTMERTFRAATQLLDEHDVPYIVIGSIAADVHGEESWPRRGSDIDLFLAEDDALRAQKVLGENGFHIEPPDEDWLLKAYREGVLVDLIFRAAKTIRLDDEMLERARERNIAGRSVRVISPEDYIVVQASTFSRETPEHWFNALGVLSRSAVDWDYVLRRAEDRRDRVLSLLVYARANGITVPASVTRALFGPLYGAA